MPSDLREIRTDHQGVPLPEGVYAMINPAGDAVAYKARWREEDAHGVGRQRSKSFSARQSGSLIHARAAAIAQREGALAIVREGNSVRRIGSAGRMTLDA